MGLLSLGADNIHLGFLNSASCTVNADCQSLAIAQTGSRKSLPPIVIVKRPFEFGTYSYMDCFRSQHGRASWSDGEV